MSKEAPGFEMTVSTAKQPTFWWLWFKRLRREITPEEFQKLNDLRRRSR